MRTPLRALLPALLVAAAGACHNPGNVLVPSQPNPVRTSNPPPTAPQLERNPPLAGDLYGVYVLRRVGGTAIPFTTTQDGCTVAVVAGTLSLERGRFTWNETQQRTCGGARSTVSLHAQGGFGVDVATLRLAADSGAFATGVGVFLGRGDLEVNALDGGTGSAPAGVRRYVKRDVLPPSPENTRGR